jgi:acyl dehydratase
VAVLSNFKDMNDNPVDYAALSAGQTVSRQVCLLDDATISAYVAAVDDGSPLAGSEFVTPMAVAALSVRGVVNDLRIPGGTLHLGQEIEFTDAVRVGETITCAAELSQNSLRGASRILVVGLSVTTGNGRTVMTGKSTIAVPA